MDTDVDGQRMMVRQIPVTEPAPTIAAEGLAKGRDVWRLRVNNQANATQRRTDAPAPTLHFGHALNDVAWVAERPATTLNADPRVSRPGRHDPDDSGSQQRDAIRVSVEQAGALQTFPPGFPWQGSRTAQYAQVGNAIPPLLARAILSAMTGRGA